MEVVETDTSIHIMTERVRPLGPAITEWQSKSAQEREAWLIWGLHRISVRRIAPRIFAYHLSRRDRLLWLF